MMVSLAIVAVVISCVILYLVTSKLKSRYPLPPVMEGNFPILGHALQFFGAGSVEMWEIAKKMARDSLKHGGVMTLFLGPRTVYAITDPDDCLTVSNECLQKDFFYDFAKPWLGEGILTADVPTWKQHRKLLNPAFKQNALYDYLCIFNDQAQKLAQKLSAEVGKGPFEPDKYLSFNNLETILRAALGADPKENRQLIEDYVIALDKILNILLSRFQKPWLQLNFLYRWTSVKRDEDRVLKVLHKLSSSVLEKRKQQLKERRLKAAEFNDTEYIKPFIDAILEVAHGNVYTDKQIQNEVDTIIFGGYDTSATALVYILLLIGTHQDVQEEAYQEIIKELGPIDKELDRQDLSRLVYLEAVIKESLRLYPIGPIVARYATKDVKLKNYTIPSGSSCFMFFWGVHRHPVWGADAEAFRPRRWLDDSLPDNAHAFGAFSVGKRACIGRVYAMMSMKTTLVYLLRRFRVYADISTLVLKIDTFLKPESGHLIRIEDRNHK